MRIALAGAPGQLGTDLQAALRGDVVALGHEHIKITDPRSIENALDIAQPDIVINAAAYNRVDRAEDEPDVAFAVNALGPRNLALYCERNKVALLHVSTDYVFGGDRDHSTPYRETDATAPLSAYGISKLAGEFFVQNLCRRHFVVRTCGLYGHAAIAGQGKGNFVETMLRLGKQRDELRIVGDQRCTPTATADLARAIAALIETNAFGLYHAANAGNTTWYELALEIFEIASIDVNVTPITTEEFGAKAIRPCYSVLDCGKLSEVVGFKFPSWKEAVKTYLVGRPVSEEQ